MDFATVYDRADFSFSAPSPQNLDMAFEDGGGFALAEDFVFVWQSGHN
jgi:hypothetical protein